MSFLIAMPFTVHQPNVSALSKKQFSVASVIDSQQPATNDDNDAE